jgi:hypothetical protein
MPPLKATPLPNDYRHGLPLEEDSEICDGVTTLARRHHCT